MGLGSFGGGTGAVKFLAARGAKVSVTDLRPRERLTESLSELADTPIERFALGGHNEEDFRQAELLVVNPAVKRDNLFLNAALRAGVPATSEMNLFWKWNRAPVVAVTGSNGKSTTTAMTHAILAQLLQTRSGRRAWVGGNIGASLLPHVDQIRSDDLVVLELSSFQLADLDRMNVSPHVAIVTNFAPNHLDWHTDLEDYRRAKQTIVRWQSAKDIAVLNDDDQEVSGWTTAGRRLGFGWHDCGRAGAFWNQDSVIVRVNEIEWRCPLQAWLRLPGRHNLANAMAATAAAVSLGASPDNVRAGLESFQALPHRLQWVADVAGRKFYNDSLATTPESVEVALESFEAPVILLAGGYDKQVDLSSMVRAIARNAKAVSLMGQTAPRLWELLQTESEKSCRVSSPMKTFRESFEWAVAQSDPGDIVLLSPGCASYDWFRNFADRGAQFAALVEDYAVSQG